MRKSLLLLSSLLLSCMCFTACDDDDDKDTLSELEKRYFTVQNATYRDGVMPQATIAQTIQGLSINNRALQGGMNLITVITESEYNRFFVGMEDVEGYYEVAASTVASTEETYYNTYIIPVMYSTEYESNITMLISAEDIDGDITEPYEAEITYVDSESGDLNINLTFSNAKDVDLHLMTPSGKHIYYGNRGGSVETVDGEYVSYGLDHDSNAGCRIDNLNNENIYLPAEAIEDGTYRVVVDMYSNCDRTTATTWSIVVRYQGNIIRPVTGSNPASGVYPVGAGTDDMTEVMTFTVSGSTRGASRIVPGSFQPIMPTDMDLMKMEEASFRQAWRQ